MDCNKDEAFRAKSIAESKLEKQDFVGAKKFALKAQTLYPGLDGIPQILTVLDVYVSAENKIGGEVDWYGVLGINPSADDGAIKKQYRKLALMLHPDKNKAVGADGAFKLISEAWTLLSDKVKRVAYNQKRGSRVFQQKPPTGGPSTQAQTHAGGSATQAQAHTSETSTQARTQNCGPSTQARTRAACSSTQAPTQTGGPSAMSKEKKSKSRSAPKSRKKSSVVPPTRPAPVPTPVPSPSPSLQRPDAFWTVCKRCKIHYEYLMIYLDRFLLCATCNEPFLASRVDLPVNYSKSFRVVSWEPQQQRKIDCYFPTQNGSGLESSVAAVQTSGSGRATPSSSGFVHHQQPPVSGIANIGSKDRSITAKASNVVHQTDDMIKRQHLGSLASAELEGPAKKRKQDDDNSKYGVKLNMDQGNSEPPAVKC